MLNGAAKPIVSARTSLGPQSQPAKGEVHVVDENEELVWG